MHEFGRCRRSDVACDGRPPGSGAPPLRCGSARCHGARTRISTWSARPMAKPALSEIEDRLPGTEGIEALHEVVALVDEKTRACWQLGESRPISWASSELDTVGQAPLRWAAFEQKPAPVDPESNSSIGSSSTPTSVSSNPAKISPSSWKKPGVQSIALSCLASRDRGSGSLGMTSRSRGAPATLHLG